MNQLTVIDFFCGAGGFSEGFRQKGFRVLKGYDNWQPAIDTFNHNFESDSTVKNILDFKDSIEEIDLLPNTDIIIGSVHCRIGSLEIVEREQTPITFVHCRIGSLEIRVL